MALQSPYVLLVAAIAGVSIKEIQTLAGHKSITMSARYAHLSPDVTASASERIVGPNKQTTSGQTATVIEKPLNHEAQTLL